MVARAVKKTSVKKPTKASKDTGSYKDKIIEAISILKDRNGASRQSIKKYIKATYKKLNGNVDLHINNVIRKLVKTGEFLQPKGASGPIKLSSNNSTSTTSSTSTKKTVKKETKKPTKAVKGTKGTKATKATTKKSTKKVIKKPTTKKVTTTKKAAPKKTTKKPTKASTGTKIKTKKAKVTKKPIAKKAKKVSKK